MPKRSSSRKKGQIAIAAITAIALAATFVFVPGANSTKFSSGSATVNIHRGTGFRKIVDQLETAGVVRFRWPVVLAGTLFPDLHKIKPGRYSVPLNLSTYSLLRKLHSSPQDEVRLMIPNGVRQTHIAAIVAANLDIDSTAFMAASRDSTLLKSLGITAASTEGYLFPGTYNFAWASTPREVITFLAGRFRAFYADSLRTRASKAGMSTHQLLTLASIVEAETPLDAEKPLIASVYLNRLKKNMRLQADPTIQYALSGPARHLYFKDLAIDSPYNTYLHAGLPPGPICNPGPAAIDAVLKPASTGYIYFVATGQGGHVFAATVEEHGRNVSRYRAVMRARSSQPDARGL